MTMPPTEVAELRAIVAANQSPSERRWALAVAVDPHWTGPETIEVAGMTARVVGCHSPLAVRAALVEHDRRTQDGGRGEELLVMPTSCTGAQLGLDVRARLIKGDVVPPDPYSSVRALFRATTLDPQLVAERWLIDDLIALAPIDGWPDRRPVSGVLGLDLAWQTWHQVRLQLADPPESIGDVLGLADRADVTHALAELSPERRQHVAARWSSTVAPGFGTTLPPDAPSPIPVLVDLLAEGRGPELLALGLVAEVLWAPTDDPELASHQVIARARLEHLFGRDRLDDRAAAAWAEAARVALGPHPAPAVLDAAEETLAAAGRSDLAVLSDVLPLGFDQRLTAFGRALAASDPERAEDALTGVSAHGHGVRRGHRLRAAEAAIRLLRRSQAPSAESAATSTFSAAVEDYVADGSWLEVARRVLAEGDNLPELTAAYRSLADAAANEQTERSHRFAGLLADWSTSEPLADARFVPVEALLDEVLAPVAGVAPVLLVVCDGMGLAVSHGLVDDLWSDGWARVAPAGQLGWPVGVATLPTVTDVSRASLLCGRRVVGGQAEERDGLAAHMGLQAVSAPGALPVLFHKRGLVAADGLALPDPIRDAVADPGQRVVAAVVNSVDDHLARGDQVRVGWDLQTLRPLGWLLDAAAEAGRVVILTADHGHVMQGPASTSRPHAESGERWRLAPPPAADDEVEIVGPRVLFGDGRVVMPADERLRYGGFKHGYHGGATPEEVLVPIEVLARRPPEGWTHRPARPPVWWFGRGQGPVARIDRTAVAPSKPDARASTPPAAPPRSSAPAPTLFDLPETGSPAEAAEPADAALQGGAWVDKLLTAPGFVAHRQRTRLPRPIADDRLRSYLEAIVANGGSVPLVALAARTGEPPDTLRLALSLVQRLLNVDGSAVLVVRAGTVELNRDLADLHFEIDESEPPA